MKGLIALIAVNLYQGFLVWSLQDVKIEVYKNQSVMDNVVYSFLVKDLWCQVQNK